MIWYLALVWDIFIYFFTYENYELLDLDEVNGIKKYINNKSWWRCLLPPFKSRKINQFSKLIIDNFSYTVEITAYIIPCKTLNRMD